MELCDESNKWRRNKAWLSKSNSLYNYNSDALLHKAVCCYASICSRSSWPLLSFVNSTHSIFFYCPVQRGTIKSKLHDVAAWPNRSKTSSIFLSFDAVERGGGVGLYWSSMAPSDPNGKLDPTHFNICQKSAKRALNYYCYYKRTFFKGPVNIKLISNSEWFEKAMPG